MILLYYLPCNRAASSSWDEITLAIESKTAITGIPYSNWLHNVSGIGVISAMAWGLGYFWSAIFLLVLWQLTLCNR